MTINNSNITISFNGGIKSILQKKFIPITLKEMEKITCIWAHTEGYVGDVPDDMVLLLKKNIPQNMTIQDGIKKIQNGFSVVSSEIRNSLFLYSANNYFSNLMKSLNLIPQNGKTSIKKLATGNFATAYKVSFLDGNNHDIIHPKCIKIFKKHDIIDKAEFVFPMFSYLIKQIFFHEMKYVPDNGLSILQGIGLNPRIMQKQSTEDIKNAVFQAFEKLKSIHGVAGELSIGLYLKKHIKNIKDSNFLCVYFGKPSEKFFVSEFSDTPVKKFFNLSDIGLRMTDTKKNNIDKYGRLIDLGGISQIIK